MHIVVLASESRVKELLQNGGDATATVTTVQQLHELAQHNTADAYIDLHFVNTPERVHALQALLPKPVIINSVVDTLGETDAAFIRLNGWTTFLNGNLIEASAGTDRQQKGNEIFAALGKSVEWVPDVPGFITPRVISMIINEAYFALAEGVSTRAEIDTAMQLGTAYPYGPFEWSRQIGLKNIVALLQRLSLQQSRYTPAPLLLQEARSNGEQ